MGLLVSKGTMGLYRAHLDLLVDMWQKNFRDAGKLEDPKFSRCIHLVAERTNKIMVELGNVRQTAAPHELDALFDLRFVNLHSFSTLCYQIGSEKAEKIEALAKKHFPMPVVKPVPTAPLLEARPRFRETSYPRMSPQNSASQAMSMPYFPLEAGCEEQTGNILGPVSTTGRMGESQSHLHSSHREHHHFGADLTVGAAARQLHHLVGIRTGRSFEVAASSLLHEPSSNSTSPAINSILSGTTHLAILEAAALLTEWPAFLTVAAVHGVEEAASGAEEILDKLLASDPSGDHSYIIGPELAAAGISNLRELTDVARGVLHVAQLPGRALHAAHDWAVNQAEDVLRSMGITDGSVGNAIERAVQAPTVLPPQSFVP